MKREKPQQKYFRVGELVAMGYPRARIQEIARSVNRHENPDAKYNSPYKLTLDEVRHRLGY